jgi:hypothetical protein
VVIKGVRIRYTVIDKNAFRDHFSLLVCEDTRACHLQNVVVHIPRQYAPPKSAHLEFYLKDGRGSRWESPYLNDGIDVDSVELVRVPAVLSVESNGHAFRVINKPGWSGISGFEYRVCDVRKQCVQQTAHVTVLPSAMMDGAVVAKNSGHSKMRDGDFPITSEPLYDPLTNEALQAKDLTIYVSLHSSMKHALLINGERLAPGDELMLLKYPLDTFGNRISLDARWDKPDTVPTGYIGRLVIRVMEPNIPDQIFPLFAGEIARRVSLKKLDNLPILHATGFTLVAPFDTTPFFASEPFSGAEMIWRARQLDGTGMQMTDRGTRFDFKADKPGRWKISLRAKKGKQILTWSQDIRVIWPRIRPPHIRRETQNNGHIRLYGFPRTSKHSLFQSEWILPDGKTQEGDTLLFDPDKDEPGLFTYRVWKRNNKEDAEEVSDIIRVNNNEWPNWRLKKRIAESQWPVEVNYHLFPDRINYMEDNLEDLSFEYTLPSNATVVYHLLNRITVQFEQGGSYTFKARVSNKNGDEQYFEDTINLEEIPGLIGALDLFAEDPWYRVPVTITVTPVLKRTFAGERPYIFRYFIDGRLLHEGNNPSFRIKDITDPGRHSVRVEVRTTHNRFLSMSDTFLVTPSVAPLCRIDMNQDELQHEWAMKTDCEENQGVIKQLKWRLSLKEQPDRFITFNMHRRMVVVPHWAARRGIQKIRLEAIDDKGAVSVTEVDFEKMKTIGAVGEQR